jgi:peptidoglycan/LPS O-acetylase OafA/YrhL
VTGSSVRGRHLPALDGLRAVAVLAVVAYHLGFSWARGGYLGVDLFFVLSGFLITSLLLEEHDETGTIRLAKFWGRRARRLLPALFVMVAAVMVFVVAEGRYGHSDFIAAIDLSSLRNEAWATLLYVANWQLVLSQHSYFAQFAAPSPLQHTWSLAIEEQFYLVWPFVTFGLVAKGLRERRWLGVTTSGLIAVGSTVLMAVLFQPGADPSRIYYGTDTRLGDLAIGALLAWLTARRPDTPASLARALRVAGPIAFAGVLGLMVVAGNSSGIPSAFMFQGGFLASAILSAVVLADVRAAGSWLGSALSWRPLVAIGLVSYGIYLWHWPVIVLCTSVTSGLTGASLLVLRLALIAVLVVASYFLIELPVRRKSLPEVLRPIVYTLAVLATVIAVLVGTDSSFVIKSYVRATLLRYAPSAVIAGSGGVVGGPIDLGGTVSRSSPLHVALVGDSMLAVADPGVVAALDATGEVTAFNDGFPGWGTSVDPHWRGYVAHAVRASKAQLVLVTTGWDGKEALTPASYERTVEDLVRVALDAGAKGVVFLQYPLTGPGVECPTSCVRTSRSPEASSCTAASAPGCHHRATWPRRGPPGIGCAASTACTSAHPGSCSMRRPSRRTSTQCSACPRRGACGG